MNNTVFLFDLDGVIIHTEPLYDIFWEKIAEKYRLGIENFVNSIRGITNFDVVSLYFSHLPEAMQQEIFAATQAYELEMDIIPVSGVLAFLENAKMPIHRKQG